MKYIKLFEHTYTIYQLATMAMWEATELLFKEIEKKKPDMDLVKDLFEYAVLDLTWQEDGWNALMRASWSGHTEIARMLLERPDILVNVQDEGGYTALMFASRRGHTEIVRMLLERPEILVNVQNINGHTALWWASERGYTKIANLIQSHPNYNPNA